MLHLLGSPLIDLTARSVTGLGHRNTSIKVNCGSKQEAVNASKQRCHLLQKAYVDRVIRTCAWGIESPVEIMITA